MLRNYEVPAGFTASEMTVKRSRFITWIDRAESEDDARGLVESARREFPDARHHCSAFIVPVDGYLPIERSSDDGEPAGTAGKPMLDVLKGSGMLAVAAVVIRYFGGIKLGAGGLVHAYSESVSTALEQTPRAVREKRDLAVAEFPHAEAGRIEAELRTHGIDVVGVDYGASASYTLAVEAGAMEHLNELLASLTHGSTTARAAGTTWVERRLN